MQDLYISEYKIAFTVDVNCIISNVIRVRFEPVTGVWVSDERWKTKWQTAIKMVNIAVIRLRAAQAALAASPRAYEQIHLIYRSCWSPAKTLRT